MERVGATDLNGTTSEDRTNYSKIFRQRNWSCIVDGIRRMGHLVGAINQKKLDEQRGVVQNEKTAGRNEPYAVSEELITKATWPAEHPYAHTSSVRWKIWMRHRLMTWRNGQNVLWRSECSNSCCRRYRCEHGTGKVKKYFGDIPSGPPVAHFILWTAKRTGEQRQIAQRSCASSTYL